MTTKCISTPLVAGIKSTSQSTGLFASNSDLISLNFFLVKKSLSMRFSNTSGKVDLTSFVKLVKLPN